MNRLLILTTGSSFLLQVVPFCSFANAPRAYMQIAISSSQEAVLNKPNLDQVKRHILAMGTRCTYLNMYNNNPCLELPKFQLYLNPDPGPDGNPQWNINCVVTRGDFNTLVVQEKNTSADHVVIEFRQVQAISILAHDAATPDEIVRLKAVLEAAVLASLAAIRAGNEIPKPR